LIGRGLRVNFGSSGGNFGSSGLDLGNIRGSISRVRGFDWRGLRDNLDSSRLHWEIFRILEKLVGIHREKR